MSRKKGGKAVRPGGAALVQASLEALRPLLPASEYPALLAELEKPPLPALRVNPLPLEDAEAALRGWARRYGWELRPVPFCAAGYWLTEQRQPASATLEHRLGYFYLQDAASMLPVELFDLERLPEHPLVLDMAASPGGKTTHLAARFRDRGVIIANDASRDRLTALRLVLKVWGSVSTAVTALPGEQIGNRLPETFDAVLLDAPCSMQGLRATSAHPLRPITPREQAGLALRQFRMLESVLRAVKPGGQIVYATCTLAPEEDEAVVDRLLRSYPHAVALADAHSGLPAYTPALAEAFGQSFHADMPRAVRLWPHHYGSAGFFAAHLIKTGSLADAVTSPRARLAWERGGMEALSRQELAELDRRWRAHYGFSPAALLAQNRWQLWQRRDELLAIPAAYPIQFGDLPFQTLGLCLAERHPAGWEPSHACAIRFGSLFNKGFYTLQEEHLAAWARGQDIPQDLSQAEKGLLLVKHTQGYSLGIGRAFPGRLKNLLPRRVVIW